MRSLLDSSGLERKILKVLDMGILVCLNSFSGLWSLSVCISNGGLVYWEVLCASNCLVRGPANLFSCPLVCRKRNSIMWPSIYGTVKANLVSVLFTTVGLK